MKISNSMNFRNVFFLLIDLVALLSAGKELLQRSVRKTLTKGTFPTGQGPTSGQLALTLQINPTL